jgi:hypothetical protein
MDTIAIELSQAVMSAQTTEELADALGIKIPKDIWDLNNFPNGELYLTFFNDVEGYRSKPLPGVFVPKEFKGSASPLFPLSFSQIAGGATGKKCYERLYEQLSTRSWSHIVFKNYERSGKNFLFADFIVLDFDGDAKSGQYLPLGVCRNILQKEGYNYIIIPTKSHKKPKGDSNFVADRYRVLLSTASRITNIIDYQTTVKYYTGKFWKDRYVNENQFPDQQCKDLARSWRPSPKKGQIQYRQGKKCIQVIVGTPLKELVSREKKESMLALKKSLEKHYEMEIKTQFNLTANAFSIDTLPGLKELSSTPEGDRNYSVFKVANRGRFEGYSKEEMTAAILQNLPTNFSEQEAIGAIESAYSGNYTTVRSEV